MAARSLQLYKPSLLGFLRLHLAPARLNSNLAGSPQVSYMRENARVRLDGQVIAWVRDSWFVGAKGEGESRVRLGRRAGPEGVLYRLDLQGNVYEVCFVRHVNFAGVRECVVRRNTQPVAELMYTPRFLWIGGGLEVSYPESTGHNAVLALATYVWMHKNYLVGDSESVS